MQSSAIALLNPHWHAVPMDNQPRKVTPEVTYEPVPPWFKTLANDDFAKDDLGEHARVEGAYCLCTRYEAEPPQHLEAATTAGAAPSPHHEARRSLQTASLMLWLSKRTSFGYDRIALAQQEAEGWVWRELTSHDLRVALPSYHSTDIEPTDFAAAYQFATVYAKAKPQGTIRTACHALGMSLSQSDWPLRYLSLWLVLESLFGPEDARETTFRLCQRMALFISPRGQEAVALFKKLNESYRWRSKIVHGMRLQKLEPDKSLELLELLESWVHGSLRTILQNEQSLTNFDSSSREAYLDHLAFAE
jgi:hypothetical protein